MRAAFDAEIAAIPCETPIAYVDECGVERHPQRLYGRALRGKRVVLKRPGKREKRLNVVAALCGDEVIAPFAYDWTTKSDWFEVWFEWHFCPLLRCGTVIILDNASFHRKPALERISAFYGCRILWLSTYSPDKNRIKHLWANLKNWLPLHFDDSACLLTTVLDYLQSE